MELMSSGGRGYWDELRSDLIRKRDRMQRILEGAKMRVISPEGGYFMVVDFSPLAESFPQYKSEGFSPGKVNTNDYRFARWLSSSKKLQGIPASAFYSLAHKSLAQNLVRFCFIKDETTLDKLEALISSLVSPSDGGRRQPEVLNGDQKAKL